MTAATALMHAPRADPELAGAAVEAACRRSGLERPALVLLYLTPQLAPFADEAIRAAARAAQCVQIHGAVASGIFTEAEWVLDAPAAAALVLDRRYLAQADEANASCVLALAAPEVAESGWQRMGPAVFGALVGEAHAQADYPVWSAGRVAMSRCIRIPLGGTVRFVNAPGLTPFTPLWRVTEVRGEAISHCDGRPLLPNLLRLLPEHSGLRGAPGLERLVACITEHSPDVALFSGEFEVAPVLAMHAEEDSVVLSRRLQPGDQLFWAVREPAGAEAQLRAELQAISDESPAEFGLMVSSIGRGAGFYGGHDRDWQLVRERFPTMPFLGLYGCGQVTPGRLGANLSHYATALALFAQGHSNV